MLFFPFLICLGLEAISSYLKMSEDVIGSDSKREEPWEVGTLPILSHQGAAPAEGIRAPQYARENLKCDIASAKLNASLGMICMGYELSLTRRFHSLADSPLRAVAWTPTKL